ncbi:MAG TPA: pyridoxal phosphate-dependent aminotransferase [Candidatus Polarisedimenticolia bacterium]|jgi:aminotransferase|nr:pyridoxal phosphate-dependent aminotransferase [Candidatus Polarisedimenticolia bacterium]
MSETGISAKAAFAARILGLVQSDIRRMSRECERAGGINLGQGICDQPAPDLIKEAAVSAIRADRSIYSKFEGIDPLRERISRKMASYNQIRCDPDREVVVTVGSTGGFVAAALAWIDPGDEVILFSPFYGYHSNILKLCGASLRFVTLHPPDWHFDPAELASAFGSRTRAVVVNTPSNPCGKVFSREELSAIASLCEKHGVLGITDEIYEYILYGEHLHVSLGSLPGMEDRTVTLSGFSKTYNMTGWRLGYAVGHAALMEKIGLLNDLLYICAPTPFQHALVTAFDLPQSYYDGLREGYSLKLAWISAACDEAGIRPLPPQGAYYLLADVSDLGAADDREASSLLLSRAGVATVPGSSFYAEPADGRTQVRLCFAKEDSVLKEACRRISGLGK